MRYLILMAALLLAVPAFAEDVTVIWVNPTESVDGTPVEPLDRFTLYKRSADTWVEVGSVSYEDGYAVSGVFDLPCGPSTVAGRVFTVAGVASWLSNKVDHNVECAPEPTEPNAKPKAPRLVDLR